MALPISTLMLYLSYKYKLTMTMSFFYFQLALLKRKSNESKKRKSNIDLKVKGKYVSTNLKTIPVAIVDSDAVQKTVSGFVVLADIFVKISPSGQEQFQFFHGTVPEKVETKIMLYYNTTHILTR